jgi:hypothetical protein
LLNQAPRPAAYPDLDWPYAPEGGDLMLGSGNNQRRVFYHLDGEPGNRRLFTYLPAPLPDAYLADLVEGLQTALIPWTAAQRATALDHVWARSTHAGRENAGSGRIPTRRITSTT